MHFGHVHTLHPLQSIPRLYDQDGTMDTVQGKKCTGRTFARAFMLKFAMIPPLAHMMMQAKWCFGRSFRLEGAIVEEKVEPCARVFKHHSLSWARRVQGEHGG